VCHKACTLLVARGVVPVEAPVPALRASKHGPKARRGVPRAR